METDDDERKLKHEVDSEELEASREAYLKEQKRKLLVLPAIVVTVFLILLILIPVCLLLETPYVNALLEALPKGINWDKWIPRCLAIALGSLGIYIFVFIYTAFTKRLR